MMDRLADDFIPRTGREWDVVKAQLLHGNGWLCCYCARPLSWKSTHIEHLVPKCQGGTDHVANLDASCVRCNLAKGGRNVAEWTDPKGWAAGEYA